jgi:hypothetical protein
VEVFVERGGDVEGVEEVHVFDILEEALEGAIGGVRMGLWL